MNAQKKPARSGSYIKKGLFALAGAAILALFAGCSQTPIFATIEIEEALKEATIPGTISSLLIARPDGTNKNVYMTNGYVYCKAQGSGGWTKIDFPATGVRCSELATNKIDGTGTLYARFVQASDWTTTESIRKWDGTSWAIVATTGLSGGVKKIGSGNGWIYGFVDDGTVTGSTEHKYTVYAATDVSGTTTFNATAIATNVDQYLEYANTSAGSFFATESYNGGAYTSAIWYYNGTTASKLAYGGLPTTNISSITCDVNGNAYVLANANVYMISSTALLGTYAHGIATSTTYPPSCVSILDTASGADYILVSGNNGYCEIPGNVATSTWGSYQTPGSSTTSTIGTSTNYASTLKTYRVTSIWGVADPAPSGQNYILYAGVEDTNKGGLWGYYPGATTPSWNRE